jgi:Na+/proline symporter
MQLALIDWIIIIAYLLLSLVIGLMYKDRAGKSMSDFFLGGRNLPWYIAGISMVATTFAADTPLAVTELVAQKGVSGNWLWWNFLFGGMLTTFFFARLWRRSEILTEVELIEFRYSGKEAAFLRGFRSVYLGLFMNALIIGWVNVALISILSVFFGIPESELIWYAAAAMVLTALYSSISGLWGVAITDVVQFVIAMGGTTLLAVIVVSDPAIGGIAALKTKLPQGTLDFFPQIGDAATGAKTFLISAGTFLAYIGVQWWASWYPGAEPGGGGYVVQRMMSTRNEKHSVFATLFFQVAHYCLRPWPWILVGLCTLVLYPDLSEADKKLGYVMAMKQFLPDGLKGLLLVAFLAAYMSTISTQLNWGASYLVNDFYMRFLNKTASQQKLVSVSRYTTMLLMLVSLIATTFITSISGVWSFIIECGAGLGLVLILRWYWWRINAWSEISATVAPFVAYGVGKLYLKMEFPESFFLTVGFTTVVWILVTFITSPVDMTHLAKFYSKVRPQGAWRPVREWLGIKEARSLDMIYLALCWLSAVGMTYSILFMTGKMIFMEWAQALQWLGAALISLALLLYGMRKTKVMED